MKTRKWTTKNLGAPLRWRKPCRVEVPDLFDGSRSNEEVAAAFGVMAAAPKHTFQVLTKRPDRAVEFLAWVTPSERTIINDHADDVFRDLGHKVWRRPRSLLNSGTAWPLPNVWLGFSAENQSTFNKRWVYALEIAALGWTTWCSLEPLLGPVELTRSQLIAPTEFSPGVSLDALTGYVEGPDEYLPGKLSWVVCGGESGPGARPVRPDWVRSLRDQCAAAGVPFNFAGWGDWVLSGDIPWDIWGYPVDGGPICRDPHEMVRVGKKAAGRLLDGVTHDGYPGEGA